MINKVIFIDRDGVINEDKIGDYIKTWEEFHFIPGALQSLKRLKENHYQVVMVSNQAGIGDGEYSLSALNDITRRLKEEVLKAGGEISGVYYCLHGKEAGCFCRKPETGLLEKAEKDFFFGRKETFFIGDKQSDITAGKRFGLKTILVLTGHGKNDIKKLTPASQPDFILDNFNEAVNLVLQAEPKKEKV